MHNYLIYRTNSIHKYWGLDFFNFEDYYILDIDIT